MREIVKNFYPDIPQVEKITQDYYATFYLSAALGDCLTLLFDSRMIPLEKVGGGLLGLTDRRPQRPKFKPSKPREITEPYVCIGVQASGVHKGWHYPKGWEIVCNYLKSLGYRVLCIDKNLKETNGSYTNEKPANAENFIGEIPLIERANMLYYADFFIGLGSGLSWLANAVGCPVVMIAGFSQDFYEFYTPYRVANRFVCNGCYNNILEGIFTNHTCLRYEGTPRELECQKKISPRQVINAVEQLIIDHNLLR